LGNSLLHLSVAWGSSSVVAKASARNKCCISLLLGIPHRLLQRLARATSGIRVSQVLRGIVCRLQEHWWLFGGDRVSISEQCWNCLWDRVPVS